VEHTNVPAGESPHQSTASLGCQGDLWNKKKSTAASLKGLLDQPKVDLRLA
jgi:hypothetical protein